MTKKEAQIEIFKRLAVYFNSEIIATATLLDYHSGEISRSEILQRITIGKNGNLLQAPERCYSDITHNIHHCSGYLVGDCECEEFLEAREIAEELIKFYHDTK